MAHTWSPTTEVTSQWMNEMEADIAKGLGQAVNKTASYTVAAADDRKVHDCNSATPLVVTLPTRASTTPAIPADMQFEVCQRGAGQVSVVGDTGVTVRIPPAPSGLKTRGRYASLSVRRYDSVAAPLTTTGLVARWKADSITGADQAAVSSWPESSGAGLPAAVQATFANQPKLRVAALNGHNTVEFDGSNDFLTLSGSALALAQNASNLLVFVAYKLPAAAVTAGPRAAFALSNGLAANASRVTVQTHIASTLLPQIGGRRLDADGFGAVPGTAQLGTGQQGIIVGSFQWASRVATLYLDGAVAATSSTFQTAGVTSNTASLAGCIGANSNGSAEFFIGQIAEIIVINAADTPALRANVNSYLFNTYGGTNTPTDYAGDIPDEWVVTGDGVA